MSLVVLVAALVTWMVTLTYVATRNGDLREKVAELIDTVNALDEDLAAAEERIAVMPDPYPYVRLTDLPTRVLRQTAPRTQPMRKHAHRA